MRTIKEDIQYKNSIVLESVIEPHMRKLIDQLNKTGTNPKDLISELYIALDKIDASRVRVIYDPKDHKREIDNMLGDMRYMIFAIKNDEIQFVSDVTGMRNRDIIFIPRNPGDKLDDQWRLAGRCFISDARNKFKSKAKRLECFLDADELWVVDLKHMFTSQMRVDRAERQKGSWENTPEFYAQWLEKNLKRYKDKINKLRASSGASFEEVTNKFNAFTKKVTEFIAKYNTYLGSVVGYRDNSIENKTHELMNVMRDCFTYMMRAIDYKENLNNYESELARYSKETGRDPEDFSFYKSSIARAAEYYNERIRNFNENLEKGEALYKECIELLK